MPRANMSPTLPAAAPGSHREVESHAVPGRSQLALVFEREAKQRTDEIALATMFRSAVQAFGGADALRAALGERETYLSKISEAIAGSKPVQLRWLLPLLDEPAAAMVVLAYLSERAGFEPPVLHREVSDEEIGRAAVEVLGESGQMRDTFRAQIAKRLGCRVEDVRL